MGVERVVRSGRELALVDIELDVTNRKQLEAVVDHCQPDCIFHLAATFSNDFDTAYAVNVESSRYLLEFLQHSDASSRLVLIGSAAEYGVVEPYENPLKETRRLVPVSVYGVTKAWQTQLAGMYAGKGVDVTIARIFNLYGDNLSEKLFVGRLQKQIDAVKAGKQAKIQLGSLSASRDYLSLAEAAQQLALIAKKGISGEIYHVASGAAITMHELLQRYLAVHRLDMSIVDYAEGNSNRSGYDVPIIYADTSKTAALEVK